jgi:translation initiation factor IF-1
MVKNDAGGNKGKGVARKHVNASKCGGSKQLRVATDEAERYAVVSKMLGNGMCYVRLLSGGNADMLCIIRNKFKGRGKRDNILDSGSWVLVGMREWASKQDTCDLLEVYNDGERDRLLKNEPCFKGVAAAANASDGDGVKGSSSSQVQFTDSTTMKYSKLVKSGNREDNDDNEDSEQVMQQQRSYDMPSDDETDDDDDESEESDEAEESEEESEEEEAEAEAEAKAEAYPVAAKTNKNARVDVINVDDI